MTAPIRRWPRFGLRTMFVVVAGGATLLGVTRVLSWKAQRERFLKERFVTSATGIASAPLALRLIGAEGYDLILLGFAGEFDVPLTDEQQAELRKVSRLFPEAEVKGHVVCEPAAPISPSFRRDLEGRLP